MTSKPFNLIAIVSCCLMLSACTGPGEFFEPTVYGVRQSRWETMSPSQQSEVKHDYQRAEELRQQQRIADENLAVQKELLKEKKRKNDLIERQMKYDRYHNK